jgi:hypothetical protein
MPLASRGENGPQPPLHKRSRAAGGRDGTLPRKHQLSIHRPPVVPRPLAVLRQQRRPVAAGQMSPQQSGSGLGADLNQRDRSIRNKLLLYFSGPFPE